MMLRKLFTLLVMIFSLTAVLYAKDSPALVMTWPSGDKPAIRFSFAKFLRSGGQAGHDFFQTTVTIENLSAKAVTIMWFTVYILDKNQVRIGEASIAVTDLSPGQQARQPFQFNSAGFPASFTLAPSKRPETTGLQKELPIKVVSVPPGAQVKLDGKDACVTPCSVRAGVGNHMLQFSKEGYATGTTPLDVQPDEGPGGSIQFELGGLSKDTVELRDGTVILGDVVSLSLTEVAVRVDGQEKIYERNRVKRIFLVEREVVQQTP